MLRPYLVLSDHLGSTSTTANQDGSFSSTIQYTAFGEIRVTKNSTLTKYRYTGQLAQAELGLDYYVARWYDPVIGHFTQADTIVPEPGKASAFDRYAYVLNNPIRFLDPSGHDRDCGIGDPGCRRRVNGEKEFKKLYEDAKNKKITDAEFLYKVFDSKTLPGSNAKDRLTYLLNQTESGPYQQFKLEFGDTGFSAEFRDGGNQVNHFLQAVLFGKIDRTNPILNYLIESIVIGHEVTGDESWGGGYAANFYQTIIGLRPRLHVLYHQGEAFDNDVVYLNTDFVSLVTSSKKGNSVQDLELTRKGFEFGEIIGNGIIDTNELAANWILNNICKDPKLCHK